MRGDAEQQVTQICERARHEIIAVLLSLPVKAGSPAAPTREWMTAKQLAEYWQLLSGDNQPRTAGILKWASRPADQFPLPHVNLGDLLRFKCEDVDRWAQDEAVRRGVVNQSKRLRKENSNISKRT